MNTEISPRLLKAIQSLPGIQNLLTQAEHEDEALALEQRCLLLDQIAAADKDIKPLEIGFDAQKVKFHAAADALNTERVALSEAEQALAAQRSVWRTLVKRLRVEAGEQSVIDGATRLHCIKRDLVARVDVAAFAARSKPRHGLYTTPPKPEAAAHLRHLKAQLQAVDMALTHVSALEHARLSPSEISAKVERILADAGNQD